MRVVLFITWLPALVRTANIILSNDDGWAELNIRMFFEALTAGNHSVVLSAPAENKSGTGSSDQKPRPLCGEGEFDSVPCPHAQCSEFLEDGSASGPCNAQRHVTSERKLDDNICPDPSCVSPPVGSNASMPRFNYVNSFPVTSIKYGIDVLSPRFFGGSPDIAVTGFNVGSNLGPGIGGSGTVGAATAAAKAGIPAIAFSGGTGDQIAWNTSPVPEYAITYATLAAEITQILIDSGQPFLPPDIYLNVNFAPSNPNRCPDPSQFEFILSRIVPARHGTPPDVLNCGKYRLPTEQFVYRQKKGCYVSISVGDATTKFDVSAPLQQVVQTKLKDRLSCLPSSNSASMPETEL